MKRFLLLLAAIALLWTPSAHAQNPPQFTGAASIYLSAGVPSGSCTSGALDINTGASSLYACVNSAWVAISGGGGGVTSIATTGPITGGTITTTGTIACATCATTTSGGAISFDKSATGLVNPTADATFTYVAASVSGLTLAGTAPASVSTSTGTNASSVFNVSGVAGGADSNATGTGGIGSSPTITGGVGGAGTGTNAVGGKGGTLQFTAGNGGGSLGTGANANGGDINLYPGAPGTGGSGTAGLTGNVNLSASALSSLTYIRNILGIIGGGGTTGSLTIATGAGGSTIGFYTHTLSNLLVCSDVAVLNCSSAGNFQVNGSVTATASVAALGVIAPPFTGGTGTTNFPQTYLNVNGATAPTTFSTSGTMFGMNAASGFIGDLENDYVNGGTSVYKLNYQGLVTQYNSVATAGKGVPPIYQVIHSSNSAAITAANLIASPATSGLYRVSVYAIVTTAATTSSALGAGTNNGFILAYTDPDSSVAQTATVPLWNGAGTANVPATGQTGNTTTTLLTGSQIISAKAAVAITYSFGYTSVGGTAMVYEITVTAEELR